MSGRNDDGVTEFHGFSWKGAIVPAVSGVKRSWAPMLLIQAVGAGLVAFYYANETFRADLSALEAIKSHGGIPLDLVAGATAGGVAPQLAKLATGRADPRLPAFWSSMLFAGFVYSIVAVQVDLFYQFQGFVFGTGRDWVTLTKKTLVDMAIFAPVISIPSAVLLFELRKVDYSPARLWFRTKNSFYRSKIMPALIPCWAFWIPMLFCIYAMPPNLQFPLAQVAEASWAVLFIFIAAGSPTAE